MKTSHASFLVIVVLALSMLAACGQAPATTQAPAAPAAAGAKTYKDMTLCYPQLGAESDWRTANSPPAPA